MPFPQEHGQREPAPIDCWLCDRHAVYRYGTSERLRIRIEVAADWAAAAHAWGTVCSNATRDHLMWAAVHLQLTADSLLRE